MPIIKANKLNSFPIPAKKNNKLRIAISHEFVELYRGDKDLRVGKILCQDYGCEIVHLGTDVASTADSHFFNTEMYPVDMVGQLPPEYYLLLMKTRIIYHRKGNVGMGGYFRFTPGIIKYLKRWKPDLIFENPFLTLSPRSYMTYAVSRILDIPLVYIDCGDIIHDLKLKHKIVLPFEKPVANHAAAVITYNNEGRTRFMRKYDYPPEKIHVIPKPIDTNMFNSFANTDKFRSQYDLNDKFTVAYFGRLCTNKGAKDLLEAAEILRYRGLSDKVQIVFVGGNVESGQSAEFKSYYENLKLPNITLTDMIPHKRMPEAYAAVDVAVFPDVTNPPGFSTVLAESMAAGLPIIIGIKGWESAVPIVDGESGLIIEAANPKQIADSIETLMGNHNLRSSIGENAARYARDEMDYDLIVSKYYSIFENILNRNGSRKNSRHVERFSNNTEKSAV